MAIDVGKAIGYLDLDTSGFENGFKTALSDLKVFQDKTASFGDKMSAIGSSLTSSGKSLTTAVTLPVVGLGTAAVKTAADFDSAMAEVQAISGATGGEFDSLRDKAKEMGAKTKFSASESAEAMKYMAMAGWKTEDMLSGIGGIMDLAAASGENLGSVSDIVTDALTAFGLQAKDSAHFSDVLAAASNNANTNVSMLGESFKYVAPVAGSLGFSVEDTSTALGIMANNGIKASAAGTALRTILTNMVKPTDQMQAAMDTLGFSMTDNEGNMKSLNRIMVDLRSGFDGLSESEKASVAASLAGKEGMSGLLAIVNTGEEDFNKLTDAINSADGTAQTMSDTMLNNLGGQLTILKSTLEGIAISFGDILMPAIQKITEKLQDFANWLNNLDEDQKKTIVTIATVVAAIGPVLLILGNLFKTLSKISGVIQTLPNVLGVITGVFRSIGTAIAGISAPLVAVIAAIGLLVAAFKHLWDTNEEFRNRVTAIWESVKNKFTEFGQGIVDRLNELGFNFESITDVIKSVWEGFCNFLAPVFEGVFEKIAATLENALDILMGLFDVFSGLFSGDWKTFWNGIKEIFTGIWEMLNSALQVSLDFFNEIFGGFFTWLSEAWTNLWNSVSEFFSKAWESMRNGLIQWISKIRKNILDFANSIVTWFKEIPKKMLDIGRNIVEGLWNGIKGAASWLKEKIFGFASSIIDGFKQAFGIASPSKVMRSQGDYLMQGLALGISNSVGLVKSQIQTVAETINNTLDKTLDTARKVSVSADFDSLDERSAVKLVKSKQEESSAFSGNQYNFTYNSPEAVNPVRAAKLLKQTAQQLALEF